MALFLSEHRFVGFSQYFIRSYVPSPDVTNALFTMTFACASTAPNLATLTSIWSAPREGTVWPTTVPTGDVTPTVVLTEPTVMALGIPIMWQSTDVEVVSWFNSDQPGSTNSKTSKATSLGEGASLSAVVLGALVLAASFIL